ncbi:MAG: hypothetical protein ACQETI_03850 [Halobacteriota archaeon]
MGRAHDAVLTALVLIPALVGGVALDASLSAGAIALGVVGTLVVEGVLSLERERVRRVWERRVVQVAAVCCVLSGSVVGVLILGSWVLVALASGLITYLALLAVLELRARTTEYEAAPGGR